MSLRAWISRRFGGPASKLQREVLAAQLQLTRLAWREGFAAVAVHATWAQSPILSQNKTLDAAPLARRLLCESVSLLRTNPDPEDYQTQLDAWLEIETSNASIPPSERSLVRCVRDAAIAFHRGARPEQAMRVGRKRLPDASQLSTTDVTQVARDLKTVH